MLSYRLDDLDVQDILSLYASCYPKSVNVDLKKGIPGKQFEKYSVYDLYSEDDDGPQRRIKGIIDHCLEMKYLKYIEGYDHVDINRAHLESLMNNIKMTATGYDVFRREGLTIKEDTVIIKIHQNTIDNLEAMIRSANIPDEDKKSLLSLVKEKGSEAVVGKLVDTIFANAGIAAALFMEAAKSKLGL